MATIIVIGSKIIDMNFVIVVIRGFSVDCIRLYVMMSISIFGIVF